MSESNLVPEPEEAKATPNSLKSEAAEGTTKGKPQMCSPKPDTAPIGDVKDDLNNLEINENTKDINILLLGCTGVGKSTFINSFVNYLTYTDFETALKRNLIVLIPSKIRVTDRNGKPHQITMGTEDKNEYIKTGEAQTQDVKTYVFPIADKNANIRLIDTPGMGDPRGIKQDDINCENILSYIGNLQELHAICFLLKPNESRDTVFFKYCMNQIFSRLDKSACYNIIFCFTNTRGTDYNPGETIDVLKKNIEEIRSKPPHASIPSDRNIFCFDNECFRYLAAFKENVDLDESLESRNVDSWEKSVKECWKLYHYIAGDEEHPPLKPHNVRSTRAVNEARRVIGRLSKPLADVAQLIQDNIDLLQRHKETLSQDTKSLEEMKNQLYMPVNTLEVFPLQHPTTVCTARQCADVTQVGGKNAWHYRQRCHEPCGLGGLVSKEIIGDPQLINCWAMSNGVCRICGCNFKVHMHVYYLTQQVMKNEVDSNIQMNITSKEQLLANKKIFLKNLETRQEELEKEHKFIIESCAKFAHFLQNNALTPFSDAYKEYIQYLVEREKSLGTYCDAETVRNLESVLAEYVQLKNQFDEALKNARLIGNPDVINAQDIRNCFENLYKLKHNGPKIKELYEVQEREIVKYHKNQEYKHGTKTFFSNFTNFISKKIFGKKENIQGEKSSANSCHHCHGGQPPAAYPYWFPYPQYWQPQPSFQNVGAVSRNAENGNDQHYKTGSRSSQNVRNPPSTTNGRNLPSPSRSYSAPNENHHQHQPNFYRGGDNPSFANPVFPSLPSPYYPGFPNAPYSGFPNTPYPGFPNMSYPNYPQAGYDPEVARNGRKEYLNGKFSEENHPTRSKNHSKKTDNNAPLLPHPNTNPHSSNAQYFNPQQFYFGNHAPPQIPYSPFFYPPQNGEQFPEFSGAAGGTKTTSSERRQLENEFEEADEKDSRPVPAESEIKSRSPLSLGKDKDRYNTKFSGAWKNNDKEDFEWVEYENKKLTKTQRKTEKRKLKKEQKR